MSHASLKRHAKSSSAATTSCRISIISCGWTSLHLLIGGKLPVTRFLARTISLRVFHPPSPLPSWPCRSSPGERGLAEIAWAGGLPSFLHFHCKRFSTRRPLLPICGWCCLSRLHTGAVTNCCETDFRLRIKHQTSNIKHLIGGGCSMSRLRSDFWPKDQSGGLRLRLSQRRNSFCSMDNSRRGSNLRVAFCLCLRSSRCGEFQR